MILQNELLGALKVFGRLGCEIDQAEEAIHALQTKLKEVEADRDKLKAAQILPPLPDKVKAI